MYEGTYPYDDGTRLVPSWAGSMFEALMPPLFVPEEEWGPGELAGEPPITVDAQIDHGLEVAGYGAWGFSPSQHPGGGYPGYGVDAAGLDAGGTPSNNDRTLVDRGSPGCPAARRARPAAERVHERRRHAARDVPRLRWRPREALAVAREARARLRRVRRSGASTTP